jgi:hypothetical protein
MEKLLKKSIKHQSKVLKIMIYGIYSDLHK